MFGISHFIVFNITPEKCRTKQGKSVNNAKLKVHKVVSLLQQSLPERMTRKTAHRIQKSPSLADDNEVLILFSSSSSE